MRHIKLYKDYDFDDIDHILLDYYHDNNAKIIKNDYYRIYTFYNLYQYGKALKDLSKHDLNYMSEVYRLRGLRTIGYIIAYISEDIIKYLNSELFDLKSKKYKKYTLYFKSHEDKNTLNFYCEESKILFVDNKILIYLAKNFKIDNTTAYLFITCLFKDKLEENINMNFIMWNSTNYKVIY